MHDWHASGAGSDVRIDFLLFRILCIFVPPQIEFSLGSVFVKPVFYIFFSLGCLLQTLLTLTTLTPNP